jgi:hypothetical protein
MVPVKPQVHPQKWLELKEFSDWISDSTFKKKPPVFQKNTPRKS